MIVEFQLASDALTTGVTRLLRAYPICLLGQWESSVVDHVEIGDCTVVKLDVFGLVHNGPQGPVMISPAYQVAVSQNVKIVVTSLAELAAAGAAPVANPFEGTIAVRFAISAAVNAGQAQMSVKFVDVDLGNFANLPGADQIGPAVASATNSLAEIPPTTIDTQPIADLLGHPVTVSNIGIATDAGGSFISVRIEIDGPFPGAVASWSSFYTSDPTSHLQGNDWCQFIDQQSLMQAILYQLGEGLYTAAQQGTFDSPGDPSGTWMPAVPGAHVTFSGEVIDACPAWIGLVYIGMIDVDLDVTLDVSISVPSPNTLAMNMKFYWTVDPLESFACAVSAATFWPAVGTILMAQGKINAEFSIGLIAEVATPFFGANGVLAGFFFGIGQFSPNLPLEKFEKVDNTNADLEYVQTVEDIEINPLLNLTDVYGKASGLVLVGERVDFGPIKHPPMLEVAPTHPTFEWSWPDLCSEPVLKATAIVFCFNPDNEGAHTPLEICTAFAENDTHNQFNPFIKVTPLLEGGTVRVAVPISAILPQYAAAPYACELVIQTNGGARLLTIPPFAMLSAAEQAELESKLQLHKVIKCILWAHFFWGKHYNPKWDGDPPWGDDVQHVWRVMLAGLAPGGQVRVADQTGRPIAIAQVPETGVAEVSALFNRPGEDAELQIDGDPPDERAAANAAAGTLAVHQTTLLQDGEVWFADPVTSVSGGRCDGRPALFCVTGGSLRVFDLSQRRHPRLMSHVPGLQLSGFLSPDRLGWGRGGLSRIRVSGSGWSVEPVPEAQNAVLDVASYGDYLYCLRDNALDVYDRGLRHRGSIELEGFNRLVRTGATLVVGAPGRVRTFGLAAAREPRELASFELPDADRLCDPRLAGNPSGTVFAGTREGAGVVWSLAGSEPVELVRYEEEPWFARTTRIRGGVAVVEQRRVTVMHAFTSTQLYRQQIDPTAPREP